MICWKCKEQLTQKNGMPNHKGKKQYNCCKLCNRDIVYARQYQYKTNAEIYKRIERLRESELILLKIIATREATRR